MYKVRFFLVNVLLLCTFGKLIRSSSNLYPRDSETRESKSLDGIWDFKTQPLSARPDIGFERRWYADRLTSDNDSAVIEMPVPSSYNDVTQSSSLRDYLGWAWYQRRFYAPRSWQRDHRTVILRFGSVHYFAAVYLNGQNVVNHTGGHLPFSVDVTGVLNYNAGQDNLLTVAVNNTLSDITVPQGRVEYKNDTTRYPPGFKEVSLNFDFFNYAGIHRSVLLYALPSLHVHDVTVITGVDYSQTPPTGLVDYSLVYQDSSERPAVAPYSAVSCRLDIYDETGKVLVASGKGCSGSVKVDNANLWWPIYMDPRPGYLYTGKFQLINGSDDVIDVYEQKIGIREVKFTTDSFLVNNRAFYFRGFGKHEDSNIRGKGLDLPLIIKDVNLIKWIGANGFRTSHYPYSEELMDECDKNGLVVIDECPAVGLAGFSGPLLAQHLNALTEMVQRDKNRPSVVMWSIANEPDSGAKAATAYFRAVVQHVKGLDVTRPISAALNAAYDRDNLGQFLDVLMVNRYYAWYSDTGCLDVITRQIVTEFEAWRKKHGKAMLISEYGADTVVGLHSAPSFVFTEDYQTEYMMNHFSAFDTLRSRGYFVGELIWNFADFMTNQQVTRVYGNKKGIFTRERQPKASARVLRCRYLSLANATLAEVDDKLMYCPATLK